MPPYDPETSRWYREEVRPHEAGLRAWLRARFSFVADPDDLLQESYLRLLRVREAGGVTNTRAFLFTTARNAALDLIRRRGTGAMEDSLVEIDFEAVEENGAAVTETVSRAEEIEILHQAIQALPERCRAIMTLQKIHSLSNREIAERLGLSINTVNAQIVTGLVRCRRFLKQRGVIRGGR